MGTGAREWILSMCQPGFLRQARYNTVTLSPITPLMIFFAGCLAGYLLRSITSYYDKRRETKRVSGIVQTTQRQPATLSAELLRKDSRGFRFSEVK